MGMEEQPKFLLPVPNFLRKIKEDAKPKHHYLTPSGMSLLPREKQPPPMYGPCGATIPSKYLNGRDKSDYNKEHKAPPTNRPERPYCEACEIEFQSKDDIRRHRAQHEHCPVEGCQYQGHPSVMDKHITTLHDTGLFDKVKKLSTPEEIAAWREQRRKRYPTLANVQMRQKAKEQRQMRGERLEPNKSRFGKREDCRRIQKNIASKADVERKMLTGPRNKWSERKNNKSRKPYDKNVDQVALAKKTVNEAEGKNLVAEIETTIKIGGISLFKGTSKLKDYKHVIAKKQARSNALASILDMYGSDYSDSEQELESDKHRDVDEDYKQEDIVMQDQKVENCIGMQTDLIDSLVNVNECISALEENPIDKEVINVHQNIGVKPTDKSENCVTNESLLEYKELEISVTNPQEQCNNESADDAPEEAPISRNNLSVVPTTTDYNSVKEHANDTASKRSRPNGRQSRRKFGLGCRKVRLSKQNTMLEKLLETDIRHERNVLLQCVRFVCENNFFDIGKNIT